MKIRSIQEAFGDPIGNYAGETLVGVRDNRDLTPTTCLDCGMMPINDRCMCDHDSEAVCPHCGMIPVNGKCGCVNEAKRKGPSKKTAKKILKGTKSFKDKMEKVSGWASNPAAAAAWMMHKASGKWPSEK